MKTFEEWRDSDRRIDEGLLDFFKKKKYGDKQIITAKNRDDLEVVIKRTLEEEGLDADLNFIDIRKVEDLSELFENSKFNGDISNWNVNNVTNMDDIFYHCPLEKNPPKWYKD